MQPQEIIKKWLEYTEYDPNAKSHNLFSMKYEFHKVCEQIKGVLAYDPTCIFAVLYAKHAFQNLMKDAKICAFDVLSDPAFLQEEKEMMAIFNSPDVVKMESDIMTAFDDLINSVIPTKMIGTRNKDAEQAVLMESIEAATEQLQKCKVDLFKKGGPVEPITNFSTHIHVFNRLSECLFAIEVANDGIYLCYINEGGSVDGYFGFMIKSNGNLLFVNERIDEAYPGQHKNTRSARYSENKQYALFPYSYIFSFSDYDRLGYATKHVIDEEKLAFFNLEPGAYMPLIIAMVMLNAKYSGYDTSTERLKYIDTLLPNSLALPTPGVEALIIPAESAIALQHREYAISITSEDVLKNTKANEFNWKSQKKDGTNYSHDEYGHFTSDDNETYFDYPNDASLFVSLYGEGFELDTRALLEANRHLKYLTSSELEATKLTTNVEFVGTKRRMDLIAYQQGRAQLAEYIKDRMAEEFFAFGGMKAVVRWWDEAIRMSRDRIIDWCIAVHNGSYKSETTGVRIYKQEESKGRIANDGWVDFNDIWYARAPFNHKKDDNSFCCCECESKATIFFVLKFNDWRAIANMVGEENIPKIIKGWRRNGHGEHGNSILSVTDAVTGIGTPFEYHESQFNPRYKNLGPYRDSRITSSQMNFVAWIGFSKRTWNRILRERS